MNSFFLDQVVDALSLGLSSTPKMTASAVLHGHDLLLQGLTVSQVVHDYGDVCQSITELAVKTNARIDADDFRLLNGCLDNAIASAVTEYGRKKTSAPSREKPFPRTLFGFFTHELRNLIHTAGLAFEVIKSGNVGVGGSTGAVLHRSLEGARNLIARSLAEVRLTQGLQNLERFFVSGFIEEEVVPAALLAANARSITLTVMPVEDADGVAIEADRQVLAA